MNDNEDMIDVLCYLALLEDSKQPSGKAIAITLVVIAVVFIVCLAL